MKKFRFLLYVSGATEPCIEAAANIKIICEDYVPGNYELEIIDVIDNPGAAEENQIIVIPTLIRISPEPEIRIIGALHSRTRVLVGLGMQEGES